MTITAATVKTYVLLPVISYSIPLTCTGLSVGCAFAIAYKKQKHITLSQKEINSIA